MTELFLDGLLAVPAQNVTIKLTTENTYFSGTSSYTYDVELPLSVEENRRIFGSMNRLDIPKEGKLMEALLMVDNVSVLAGKAHIMSVSETSVKVQLLGENASYNYEGKMDESFIDMMDLGNWYMETWPDGSYYTSRPAVGTEDKGPWYYHDAGTVIPDAGSVLSRAYYKGPEHGGQQYTDAELLEKIRSGVFGWVAYPTFNEAAGLRHNATAWRETAKGSRVYNPFIRTYEGERGNRDREPVKPAFSIQPYVWKMAEVVAKATGYTLAREENALFTDPLFRRIFIANTSTSALCNRCVPHWSVNEWWNQIENTFGVVMSVDYGSRTMRLLRRVEHYRNAARIMLDRVVDEYETTLEDDTQTDISANNVGYADHDNGPEDNLSEEIKDNAVYMDFGTSAELLDWCVNKGGDLKDYKNHIFRCADGRHYIYSTDVDGAKGIIEVDMFRPRIVNPGKEDVEVELKIVPARFTKKQADIFATWDRHAGAAGENRDIPDGTFEVRMIMVPGQEATVLGTDNEEKIDIQAIIEGKEDAEASERETQDLLYIAIDNPGSPDSYTPTVKLESGGEITRTFEYPRARLRERSFARLDGEMSLEDSGESLSLIPIEGQNNMAKATITGMVAIDTVKRYCIKFISGTIPDPGAIFYVRNRLFVCEKIEANIKPEGLDKLLTGYFYEFES